MNGLRDRPLASSGSGGSPPNPLIGKKVACAGTSLTYQGFFTGALATLAGVALTNLGFSGGALAEASNGHYGSQKIYDSLLSIPADAEIVIIECGTNDFSNNGSLVTLGARGDTTIATFYGALYAAAARVRSVVPNAKLFFMTDHGGDSRFPMNTVFAVNSKGNKLAQFQQAMEEVCKDLGLWLLDSGRKANVGYLTGADTLSDGLHYNSLGGSRVAAYLFGDLKCAYDFGYFNA